MQISLWSNPAPARPFVKWVGGKGRISAQIRPHVPAFTGTYHEPFVGGGAMFYALAPHLPAGAILSDLNEDLIVTYQQVRDHLPRLVALLRDHERAHSPDFYQHMRSHRPTSAGEIAAWFIYLNRTCYNGMYRVNRAGGFNAPMGRYAHPHICDPDKLARASATLHGQAILHAPFQDVAGRARAGDLVYFDPPYVPRSPTSAFTSYTPGGFTYADHLALRDTADQLRRRGVHVLISNSDTPITRELYAGWQIVPVLAPRAINSNGAGRGAVGEILATATKA